MRRYEHFVTIAWLIVLPVGAGCGTQSSPKTDITVAHDGGAGPDVDPGDAEMTEDAPIGGDVGPGCGNGVRDENEQCDDGNQINLDGCDALCRFEQVHRVSYLQVQHVPHITFCTKNAFGAAVVSTEVRDQMKLYFESAIASGALSILYKWCDLDDLTGATDSSFTMGVMAGDPVTAEGYDGTDDLDWWYTVHPSTIDALRMPVNRMDGTIESSVLTAGPGKMTPSFSIIGVQANLEMTDVMLKASVGAASQPLRSRGGPPGHSETEHLDLSLSSFEELGAKTSSVPGLICGKISAYSLSNIAVPLLIAGGCKEGYSTSSTMLDVFVGGCDAVILSQQAIAKTQPDGDDSAVPPIGDGPPYTLILDDKSSVSACQDKSGNVVSLNGCLMDATYSVYLTFGARRVIIR